MGTAMRVVLQYVVAASAVAVATAVTWLAWGVLQPAAALLFAAVMLGAWFGGLGPGLLASLAAALIAEFLFTERGDEPYVTPRSLIRLGVFLSSAGLISWLNAERHRAERVLRRAHEELEKRVEERTADLTLANERLQQEIRERQRAEREILSRQAQLRKLASELALAEERQLRRLAVSLHDGIGQLLAMARIRVDLLEEHLDAPDEKREAVLEIPRIGELLDEAIQRTRSLTVELSPPVLYEAGLSSALQWLAGCVRERHGIDVEVAAPGPRPYLSDELSVFLFQAVRELLTNMTKHAHAGHGQITVTQDPHQLRVTVEDDGVGFDPATALDPPEPNGHAKNAFGLFSIRERLKHHGGHLEVEATPGRGSRFTLVLPLDGGQGDE